MSKDAFSRQLVRWEDSFRTAAMADDYAVFRQQLKSLGLPQKPKLMLGGTILMLYKIAAYYELDSRKFGRFLRMQTYDPSKAEGATYAFTFDVFGKAYPRMLVETKFGSLDLADLYGTLWRKFKVAGYSCFYVSRVDGGEMTPTERASLETEVSKDLEYDYGEDELQLSFDPAPPAQGSNGMSCGIAAYIRVVVQDVED